MISRLKSLELQGYKTFASRTAFEFPGAVTAIVGPNGSGKSNITDALRWVLGEQSYSLLRGKKTEDMIFSGSERRTRSGMATATIILDNSDNWLPIDYSEVSIARRAYRDGSNEYLLNGQRVRLRDVSELLSESGLAERTYTIIGQGLVDAALALRAEDRRRLFEEAAGIGLHRTRRQEAVRRLADTQRNLERVEDILQELRPRLRSLDRQARRAAEYDQAVADLKELLREWYGFHWHKAQEGLAEAKKIVNEQSVALDAVRERESQLVAEINLLREKRQRIREEVSTFHKQSAELHSRREIASRELAVAEERERYIREQERKSRADLLASVEEVGLLDERNKFALDEVARLGRELEEAKERNNELQEELDKRQQIRNKIDEELNMNRQRLIQNSTLRLELKSRNAERQALLENLEKSAKHGEESITTSEKKSQELANRIADSASEQESAKISLDQIKSSKLAIEESILEYKSTKDKLANQITSYETQLSKLKTQYDVLKQAEQSYVGYSSGVKILLEAASEARLPRSKGILGSNINVPVEFEIAISAVLDEYIDALVLESQDEVNQALNILEKSQKKAAILPLDALLADDSSIEKVEGGGILGLASEKVSAPADILPAIKLLLGNVLIVDNRANAQEVIRNLRQNSQKFDRLMAKVVTLTGEVFHVQGPVKTSSNSKPPSLSRPREMLEIAQKQAQIEENLEDTTKRLAEIDNTLSEVEIEEKQIDILHEKQWEIYEKSNSSHRQLVIEAEQIRREMDWQVKQLAQLKRDIEDSDKQIKSSLSEIAKLDKLESEIENQIDQQVNELRNHSLDDIQENLAHWKTRNAVLEQAFTEAKVRQDDRERLSAEAINNSERISSSIESLTTSRDSTREDIKQFKGIINEVEDQIEVNNSFVSPLDEELERTEQLLTEMLTRESKERVVSSQAEQKYTQARIAHVRKQESLDALRRQIESDLGLVAFEYREEVSGPTPLPLEGFVEDLPLLEELSEGTEKALNRQRSLIRRIGPVSQEAQIEFQEVNERYQFLSAQVEDLEEAAVDVQRVIEELDEIMEREFCNTFDAVAEEFHQIFGRLFGGGSARLVLTDPDDLTDTGIDIEARLPGRREQGLSLLSGGERSLTAVALVFALLRVSPTPFCVLDEVDAMLDEANVGRFRELLRELSQTTQFILITHNRATVQVADVIYGVTMGRDSTSQILSLKVDEIEKVV